MSTEGLDGERVQCDQCGVSFTETAWPLHAHNPSQAPCAKQGCARPAVGYRQVEQTVLHLCGWHLLSARRNGQEVTIVEGAICQLCHGLRKVHSQGTKKSPGEWILCPHCLGLGYDLGPQRQALVTRRLAPSGMSWRRRDARRLRDEDEEWLRDASSSITLLGPRKSGRAPRTIHGTLRALLLASVVIVAGAAVGVLFVFPLLPDAATERIVDLQQQFTALVSF